MIYMNYEYEELNFFLFARSIEYDDDDVDDDDVYVE